MAKSGHLDHEALKTAATEGEHEHDNLYDPPMLARMSRVLDAAWTEAQDFYGASSSDASVIRIAMAERIIEAIEAGVQDEESLKRAALTYRLDDTD